jgi:uncharacterized membrane protein
MAGIGFELRRLIRKNTIFGELEGYLYATVISSGPWVLSVLCLAGLGIYYSQQVHHPQHLLFRVALVYCYAFSLIVTGPIQMVTTRYLADCYYVENEKITVPCFVCSLGLTLIVQTASGLWLLRFFEASLAFKLMTLLLYLTISSIWIGMVFLSAAKGYRAIVGAFFIGTAISLTASIFLGDRMGIEGLMAGYLLGQIVILLLLVLRLLVEFEPLGTVDWRLLKAFKTYWTLGLTGLFLNAGVWIDKMIFWWSHEGEVISGMVMSYRLYETCTFLAYLSVVPSMGYFLIKIETDFYESYREFFQAISRKKAYAPINQIKNNMGRALSEGARGVLIIQGTVTGLMIYLAPWIIEQLRFSPMSLGLIRISMIGSMVMSLFMLMVIMILYLDQKVHTLLLATLFMVSNGVLTWLSLQLGFAYYGYGFTYASLISLLAGAWVLEWSMRHLEFLVFARQKAF